MKRERTVRPTGMRRLPLVVMAVVALTLLPAQGVGAADGTGGSTSGFTHAQLANLMGIAKDTWKFYSKDGDPKTHLPLDNLTFAGRSAVPTGYGRYTSAANIGVYLWAVVAANDLGLVSRPQARAMLAATLTEVASLKRSNGFLYQWYDTTSGHVIGTPGA